MDVQLNPRGTVELELMGLKLKMVPSFKNLSMLERSTGKGCVFIYQQSRMGNIAVSEIAMGIAMVARPVEKGVKLPKEWDANTVGQAIMDEGFDTYVGVFCEWLNAAMSAGPKKRTEEDPESGEA